MPHCITGGLGMHPSPPLLYLPAGEGPLILAASLLFFSLLRPVGHLPLFIWSLKPRNCSLHPPFFQSPLKFIGFNGGLPVLPPCGNRDQSIHYLDRDGCWSLCTVPITRTSKGGSPLFQCDPPIQDSPALTSLCSSPL